MMSFWKPGSTTTTTNYVDKTGEDNQDTIAATAINSIIDKQQELPILKHERQILYALTKFQIVVIVGETGCGKSTQIPQMLLRGGWALPIKQQNKEEVVSRGQIICCTQPRRLAAITLAQRVASEQRCDIGTGVVGYVVRFDSKFDANRTKIKFVTDGLLVREAFLHDPYLMKYSVIVIDEAHERGVHTDVLTALLKKIRRKRPNLRVIICSATIDAEFFLDFFTRNNNSNCHHKSSNSASPDGTIISVDGRQYPVDILYSKSPVADYLTATVDTILHIHRTSSTSKSSNRGGDILCFLPTGEDIDNAIRLTEEMLGKNEQQQLELLPLYGSLPVKAQMRVFQSSSKSSSHHHTTNTTRRVIFATNIAETSVTVPNIYYVVDCGFVKMPYFDSVNGFERLIVGPVSKASSKQRAGRAGRIGPGKCYRLYTEDAFQKILKDSTYPEVLRTNLSSFVLYLKALGIFNLLDFDFITPPSKESIVFSLETLYALGAIDNVTNITQLGNEICELPVNDPRVAKMLLYSLDNGCSEEIICIASVLQVRDIFLQPKGGPHQKSEYDMVMGEVVDRSGDHVTFVNILHDRAHLVLNSAEDAHSYFLNFLAITRANEIRNQIRKSILKRKRCRDKSALSSLSTLDESERSEVLRKCVTSGFFFNVAKMGNDGIYYTLRGKKKISVSAQSMYSKYGSFSHFIVYGETFDGRDGELEAKNCSAIDGRWLKELAPHYWK